MSGLLLVLLLAGAAFALEPQTVEAPSIESCAKQPPCWKLVRGAFEWNFQGLRTEAEASGPGRYYPGLVVFTKGSLKKTGHFLELRKVKGGGPGEEVFEERQALEERLVKAALLSSLPRDGDVEDLYDPQTLRPKAKGLQLLVLVQKAKPKIWTSVAAWVFGGADPETEGPARVRINGKASPR